MGAPLANPHAPGDEDYDCDFDSAPYQAVTCEQPMTEGRHYWEVELASHNASDWVVVGAVRPGQDCDDAADAPPSSAAIFMLRSNPDGHNAHLFGNGKTHYATGPGCDGDVSHVDEGEEHVFQQGDRIGALLDLDAGWLRFYRNGARLRQEFTSGVTGPLLRCVQLHCEGAVLRALPGAEAPDSD
jgi:hypothetical protein